ncbi:MAG: Na(+)-translocating NADH-quinone reductase subunit A [Bacteroidetes bacterium]|nr:Na(+)-translocating NADH-quinone reductase subunit A [Bacteroidota bacterium]
MAGNTNVSGKNLKVLKKGYDIKLKGEAAKQFSNNVKATTFAVQPPNFIGISPIPKLLVEEGNKVKAGDPIFFDKKRPDIKYVAPVSGEVVAVKRGAKRAINAVVILADKEMKFREYAAFDLENSNREALVEYLLESGVWPMIKQRPFNIVPKPTEIPRDIFISTFDTAPLAPDLNFVVEGKGEAFQKGLDVLNKLTEGKVHLGIDGRGKETPSPVFTEATGVEKHWFKGKHPAGNVGIQIHHIRPINSNDKVWVMGVQEVITLGALFTEGRFNTERILVLAGAALNESKYVKTYLGANIGEMVKGILKEGEQRIISGDVLSGAKVEQDEFLHFHDDQITVIKEGNDFEVFGWLIPGGARPSVSRTFTSFLFPSRQYEGETNTHGEKRAFVVTNQYERVLPMDIFPQHLMKAIIVNDFERMEGLGIYELSEEDIALCEFVCTSKQPLQQILRKGLDIMREQS